MTLRATLVTDGTSDVVLLPVLQWLMRQLTPEDFEIRWADPRAFPERPRSLAERLIVAIQEYPCQLLFVHRDAEKQEPGIRYQEIEAANRTGRSHVCVVPVRMQEAWLLHDEAALREAAGRPTGTEELGLPPAHASGPEESPLRGCAPPAARGEGERRASDPGAPLTVWRTSSPTGHRCERWARLPNSKQIRGPHSSSSACRQRQQPESGNRGSRTRVDDFVRVEQVICLHRRPVRAADSKSRR